MNTAVTFVAIAALVGFALYRQTRISVLTRDSRYRMALIYGIVGVCLGVHVSHNSASLALLSVSLLASAVVGVLRARRTELWRDAEGQVLTRGTPDTVGLFLGLVAFKFALGTLAYLAHVPYRASLGEVMVMIALMLAVQASLVWRRVEARGWAPRLRTA